MLEPPVVGGQEEADRQEMKKLLQEVAQGAQETRRGDNISFKLSCSLKIINIKHSLLVLVLWSILQK